MAGPVSSERTDGYNYASGETARLSVEEDDILISAYQPQSQLARVFFEPNPRPFRFSNLRHHGLGSALQVWA